MIFKLLVDLAQFPFTPYILGLHRDQRPRYGIFGPDGAQILPAAPRPLQRGHGGRCPGKGHHRQRADQHISFYGVLVRKCKKVPFFIHCQACPERERGNDTPRNDAKSAVFRTDTTLGVWSGHRRERLRQVHSAEGLHRISHLHSRHRRRGPTALGMDSVWLFTPIRWANRIWASASPSAITRWAYPERRPKPILLTVGQSALVEAINEVAGYSLGYEGSL